MSAPYVWRTRVYWEDTDGGGVVYYANYLKFLERARTEWLRERGYSQAALAIDPGILFMVIGVNVEYHAPARLDDLLAVSVQHEVDSRTTASFVQQVRRDGDDARVLVDARVRVVCVDSKSLRPRRIAEFFK